MPGGMQLEGDINLLIGFESGCKLSRLQAAWIYGACHLSVINILLTRIDRCCWSRGSCGSEGGSLCGQRHRRGGACMPPVGLLVWLLGGFRIWAYGCTATRTICLCA